MAIPVCITHVCEILIPLMDLQYPANKDHHHNIEQMIANTGIKQNFEAYDDASQQKMKNALQYSIHQGSDYCRDVFESLLIDPFPGQDYKLIMIKIWDVLFKNEDYQLKNPDIFQYTEDQDFCNSLIRKRV